VWLSNVGTPVTSSNGNDRELGGDDGTSDGGSDFLGALDTETDVTEVSAIRVGMGNIKFMFTVRKILGSNWR
jgi:hypothetical protein